MPIDWARLLNSLQIPCWESGKNVSPGHVNIKCPYCDDKSNHYGFNINTGSGYCWRCHKGSPAKAISLAGHIPYNQALTIISEFTTGHVSIHNTQKLTAQGKSLTLPGSKLSKYHIDYLENRGFDSQYLEQTYNLTGTVYNGFWNGIDFSYRIIIPLLDHLGNLCSFQGRDYTNKQELRYKGCPIQYAIKHHKHTLYGAHLALNSSRIVVVEGIFDQWKLGPGSVATFGTSLTKEQIKLLSNWSDIVFLFDPEEDAQALARKYAVELSSMGCSVSVVNAELGVDSNGNYRDPGDLSLDDAKQLMINLGSYYV